MAVMELPAMKNWLALSAATIGVARYCYLLSQNEYEQWAYPLIWAASISYLLFDNTSVNKYNGGKSKRRHWPIISTIHRSLELDIHSGGLIKLTWLLIVIPCTIFVTKRMHTHWLDLEGKKLHKELANDFGKLSAAAMSFFLIPVSKHSILLQAVGIPSIHATRLHVWAGCVALFGGIAHGVYYCIIWWVNREPDRSLVHHILPLDSDCWQKNYDSSCHKKFVNTLGLLCGGAFLALGLTSLWWIRRNYYKLFYYTHITCSMILLFGLLMHYNKMILYLAPSLLYYAAATVPNAMEYLLNSAKSFKKNANSCITSVLHIPDSGGCVEVTLAKGQGSSDHDNSICGAFVRLMVPSISLKSHPFTVFHGPNCHESTKSSSSHQEVKILFRQYGHFTRQLATRLSVPPSAFPEVVVSGLHPGANQLEQAAVQDKIVIITGGVGIVCYLSLMVELLRQNDGCSESEAFRDEGDDHDPESFSSHLERRKTIQIHWSCRDEGLISHIVDNYLVPLSERSAVEGSAWNLAVSIYHTRTDHSSVSNSEAASDWNSNDEASTSTIANQPFSSSEYKGGQDSLLDNLIPTATFASICFGGYWVIHYCYDNFQHKHIVETRPTAAILLLLYALAVSVGSLALFRIRSRVFRPKYRYSQLESSSNDDEDIAIECTELPATRNKVVKHTDGDDDDDIYEDFDQGESPIQKDPNNPPRNPVSIQHIEGRPELSKLVHDEIHVLLANETNSSYPKNIGVFLSGPTAMREATKNALYENKPLESCSGSSACMSTTRLAPLPFSIYEEVFEL